MIGAMISADILSALFVFCLVSSITPGPNNLMLLSSGATFGLRRTAPHILGVSSGCALMVLVLGWSLAGIAQHLPTLYIGLHIASSAYLLWLAWRIATSSNPQQDAHAAGRPLSVLDAAAFQWVNPKAWAMALGAVATFARPGHIAFDVPVIALVLVVVGLPCITLWAGSGYLLKSLLRRPRTLRAFNIGMAALLVLSILPGLWQWLHNSGGPA
jgi:threonine/homoserine/homoserine lactone efflux protein